MTSVSSYENWWLCVITAALQILYIDNNKQKAQSTVCEILLNHW